MGGRHITSAPWFAENARRSPSRRHLRPQGSRRRVKCIMGLQQVHPLRVAINRRPATLGNNGIGKSKLLSKAARNPYATYASSCTTCKQKVDQGRTYCHKCAYKANACAMCGKTNSKSTTAAPVIAGQKFTLK